MEYKLTAIKDLIRQIDALNDTLTHGNVLANLSAIDRDLALEKLRKAYDLLLNEAANQPAINTVISATPVPTPIERIETTTSETKIIEWETPVKSEPIEPVVQKVKISSTMTEEFLTKGIQPSVHDKLESLSQRTDLASKLQSKPLKSISGAIGINDRFQFIHELFKGDTVLYNNTIEAIDQAHDFNAAFSYISDNFNWDMEHPLVQALLNLIRRKFIPRNG